MRSTLLLFTLSTVLVAPAAFAKTEVELLREKVTSQQQELNKLKGKPAAAPKVAAPKAIKTPTAAPTGSGKYVVVAGDSLERIARKSGTSSASLAKANGLKPDAVIHPGQALKVPGKAVTAPVVAKVQATPATPQPATATPAAAKISKKPAVQEATVAKKTASAPASLVEHSPAMISTPSKTAIAAPKKSAPAKTSSSSTPESEIAQETSSPAAEPMVSASTSSPNPEKKTRLVMIDNEMIYSDFAAKHGTDAARLNALNGLDLSTATVLAKGSELYVPAQP